MKNVSIKWVMTLLAAMLLVACGAQKGPAQKAVADISGAIASIRSDATRYAPAELQQAEAALTSLQDQLSKHEYNAVVEAAPAVSAQVATLQQTVIQKRTEAEAAMAAASSEWQALTAEVPQMVQAIQSRVDILAQSKKLPKNVSKDAFAAAQQGLEATKTAWTDATAAFGSGDPVKAVQLGKQAKESGTAVLQSLGMG